MRIHYDTIIKDVDTRIRTKSQPVKLPLHEEDRALLTSMLQYVRDSQDEAKAAAENLRPAVGIAAIQLGIAKKLLAVVVPQDDGKVVEYALANARIVSESVQRAYLKNGEGCLSVEEEHAGIVPRAARVTVRGYDLLQDKDVEIRAKNYLAIVLQHEIDHFAGTLFYDHIHKADPWQPIPDAVIIE